MVEALAEPEPGTSPCSGSEIIRVLRATFTTPKDRPRVEPGWPTFHWTIQ